MKKIFVLGIGSLLILSGCQTNQVKLSKADASTAYVNCISNQLKSLPLNAGTDFEIYIDTAIKGCSGDAMNYAMVFARDYHQRADKHYEHAHNTYKPIIEKTSKEELMKLVDRK